jgi:methylenetetrahydrofolate reductase (NADPH)
MLKKITDVFNEKERTFSFELFPPRTEKGHAKLLDTIHTLCGMEPDFISCTYGAGGGNREQTMDIVQHIQNTYHVIGLAHLTCVCNTKDQIQAILKDIEARGITNILALRGDPPQDNPDWTPGPDNFHYSKDLCAYVRRHFDDIFCLGVAGFPEGHVACPDKETDMRYLKMKIDHGADFVITQLFFDNRDYFDFVKRARAAGITQRIIPGIFPITNYPGLKKFLSTCGGSVTDEVKRIFEPIAEDKEATLAEGIEFAVRQCKELLDGGAPGLHFFTLNKSTPVDKILDQVR